MADLSAVSLSADDLEGRSVMLTGTMIGLGVVLGLMWTTMLGSGLTPVKWDLEKLFAEGFLWIGTGTFVGWLVEGLL